MPPCKIKKIQLWALNISAYNCNIEYIPGTKNVVADFLSRLPTKQVQLKEEEVMDINDNNYEINVIDSSALKPRSHIDKNMVVDDIPDKTDFQFQDFNMNIEQEKDLTLQELKNQILRGKAPEAINNKHILIENALYYISDVNGDPMVRLYIPSHIKPAVAEQYHDKNGHMGIDKTFEAIRNKYYWPNMFKEMYAYVTTCVACQTRNLTKVRASMQETPVPPYPFCHIGVDVSGPYPTTLSGNKYIIGFIDLYSGWPEAFSVPAKTTDNVAHLLIEEIIPRHSGIQILTSDNGGENYSKVMQEVCEELNIKHIKTSFYHPQGNAKLERFHRTLHDILSKLTKSWICF